MSTLTFWKIPPLLYMYNMYLILISTSCRRLCFTMYYCHQKIDKAKIYSWQWIKLYIQDFIQFLVSPLKKLSTLTFKELPGYLALTFVDISTSTPSPLLVNVVYECPSSQKLLIDTLQNRYFSSSLFKSVPEDGCVLNFRIAIINTLKFQV